MRDGSRRVKFVELINRASRFSFQGVFNENVLFVCFARCAVGSRRFSGKNRISSTTYESVRRRRANFACLNRAASRIVGRRTGLSFASPD
jgi:hypothetical protein